MRLYQIGQRFDSCPSAREIAAIAAFLSNLKINEENGCWEWQGFLHVTGYGYFWDGTKKVRVHRWAYEHFNKTMIPAGLQIDHLCRNRKCVNPAHLEAVTPKENTRRGVSVETTKQRMALVRAQITHCPKGHPYTEENSYYNPYINHRACKACSRESCRRWRLKQKQKSLPENP